MNPYERIDALEALTREQQRQIAQLASSHAALAVQHAALCVALGQSVDQLPGEKPIPQEKARKGH